MAVGVLPWACHLRSHAKEYSITGTFYLTTVSLIVRRLRDCVLRGCSRLTRDSMFISRVHGPHLRDSHPVVAVGCQVLFATKTEAVGNSTYEARVIHVTVNV